MFEPQKDASKVFSQRLFEVDYWRSLAPALSVMGDVDAFAVDFAENALETYNRKLVREGYVQIPAPGTETPLQDLTILFAKLADMGLPPVFAFVYDEVWALNARLKNIMGKVVGDGYLMLPDFWCWNVPAGEPGWAPHRDKDADCLLPDGSPKWVTVWIPITEAHPLNSCMYVLPADRDPLYGVMGAEGLRGELSDIRALPGDPGDVYIWTQHLLHWGSRSAEGHGLPPRMSIAFEYQRADMPARDRPLVDPLKPPSFEQRLALIAKQICYYRDMLDGDDALFGVSKTIQSHVGHTLKSLGVEPKTKTGLFGRFARHKANAEE
ncbi:MAG: hypothetical protein COB37_11800 [Kordiimonadales bacterium]|nr:MAG: hypothetical protein COB37_11800 [Kordiimonadales bacterium]